MSKSFQRFVIATTSVATVTTLPQVVLGANKSTSQSPSSSSSSDSASFPTLSQSFLFVKDSLFLTKDLLQFSIKTTAVNAWNLVPQSNRNDVTNAVNDAYEMGVTILQSNNLPEPKTVYDMTESLISEKVIGPVSDIYENDSFGLWEQVEKVQEVYSETIGSKVSGVIGAFLSEFENVYPEHGSKFKHVKSTTANNPLELLFLLIVFYYLGSFVASWVKYVLLDLVVCQIMCCGMCCGKKRASSGPKAAPKLTKAQKKKQ